MTVTDRPEPSPAELFERFFGPSVFEPWTAELLDLARPRSGEDVLDLACATGIVARRTAPRVGADGRVVGLDLDREMLRVARERAEAEGVGIQFFADPPAALRETRRVLADGGRLALNVWQPLARHPVYSALLEAEADHLDAELDAVAKPFTFGDDARLRGLLREAGFEEVDVAEQTLEVEFPEPRTFVRLTVMAGAAVVPELAPDDPGEREALIAAVSDRSSDVLDRHREGDVLRFPMPNYMAVARG